MAVDDEAVHDWRKHTILPPDLTMFNFTSLEDGTRRVMALDEQWKGAAKSHPTHMMELDCEPSWGGVDQWWEEERPVLRNRLIPVAKDHTRQTKVREADEYGSLCSIKH